MHTTVAQSFILCCSFLQLNMIWPKCIYGCNQKGEKAGLASWYNLIRSYSPLAFDIKFFEPMFGCFGFFAVNWQVCYWVKKVQMMRSLKWDHSPCHLDQAALCSKSGLITGCPCWGTAITGIQNINQSYSMLLAAFAFVSQDEGDAGVSH